MVSVGNRSLVGVDNLTIILVGMMNSSADNRKVVASVDNRFELESQIVVVWSRGDRIKISD